MSHLRYQDDADALGGTGEQPGVVVGPQPVGAALHQAVHHRYPGGPCDGQQPRDIGQRIAPRLFGQGRQAGVGADDRPLQFLGDHGDVTGTDQAGESVKPRHAGTS